MGDDAFYFLLHRKLQGFSSSFLRFICWVGSCDCFNNIVLLFRRLSFTLFYTMCTMLTVYIPQKHTRTDTHFIFLVFSLFSWNKKGKTHPPEVIYYSSTNNCACVIIIPYIQREGEAEITIHGVCVHVMYFIHTIYMHDRCVCVYKVIVNTQTNKLLM